MNYYINKSIIILALFLFTEKSHSAGCTLRIEPEIGFQTYVPDGHSDSTFGNYPVCAIGIEPSWTKNISGTMSCMLTNPVNLTKYLGGSSEVNIAPKIALEKWYGSYAIRADCGMAYYFTPVAYDPTIPEKYLEYSIAGELEKEGTTDVMGKYTFFLLSDLASSRLDFKNVLHFKITRQITTRLDVFIKMGCAWNISNTEGAGYVQPLAASGVTLDMPHMDVLVMQLFFAYSFFKPSNVPVLVTIGRGRWGKKTDTLSTYTLSTAHIPFINLYCGYDRKLTSQVDIHFYYMPALFGRGQPDSIYLSHQTGIICSWSRR